MTDSLVTTAARAIDRAFWAQPGKTIAEQQAEVVVGAVLAALREQVEAIPRPDTHFESEVSDMVFDSGWAMMREAVLALLAVVENDQ